MKLEHCSECVDYFAKFIFFRLLFNYEKRNEKLISQIPFSFPSSIVSFQVLIFSNFSHFCPRCVCFVLLMNVFGKDSSVVCSRYDVYVNERKEEMERRSRKERDLTMISFFSQNAKKKEL